MLSEIGDLICFRHLFRLRAVATFRGIFLIPVFLHACATLSELPSNISTMAIYILHRLKYRVHRETSSVPYSPLYGMVANIMVNDY